MNYSIDISVQDQKVAFQISGFSDKLLDLGIDVLKFFKKFVISQSDFESTKK